MKFTEQSYFFLGFEDKPITTINTFKNKINISQDTSELELKLSEKGQEQLLLALLRGMSRRKAESIQSDWETLGSAYHSSVSDENILEALKELLDSMEDAKEKKVTLDKNAYLG